MQALLIIIAIIASSVLLFRTTVKPRNPYLTLTEGLSTRGLLYSLEILGGRCVSTESGGGLSADKLCRRINKSIKRICKCEHPENSVYAEIADNKELIVSSAESARKACRKSYMLGHVDGVPRIFLFCRVLTENTRGAVGKKLLASAVEAFSKKAPLSYAELASMPDMLRTALIGLLAQCIDNVEFFYDLYESGKRDGAQSKIDLDGISYDDYVCGLFAGAGEKDKSIFDELLTRNDISRSDAENRRRDDLAEMCVTVHFILESLVTVNKIDDGMLVSLSSVNEILSEIDGYREYSDREKRRYLEAIGKRATRSGKSEADFAVECVDSVKLVGGSLSTYVFPKDRGRIVKLSVIVAIALATVVSVISSCVFLPTRYAAASSVLPIVFLYVFCKTAVAVCPSRYLPHAVRDVFSRSPSSASDHFHICFERFSELRVGIVKNRKLLSRRERTEIMSAVLCEAVSTLAVISSIILFFVCAVDFDYAVFFIAMLPYIATCICALYSCVKNMSARPLIGLLNSVYEHLNAPVYAVYSILAAILVVAGKNPKVPETPFVRYFPRVSAFVLSCAQIVLAGIFGGYIICAIGGVQIVAAVVDIPIVRIKGKKKRSLSNSEIADLYAVPLPSTVMFYGGDTALCSNVIGGDGISVTADNRGRISARCGSTRVEAGDLDIKVSTMSAEYRPAHCDGAHMTGRTVYFTADEHTEISAEVTAPNDPRCVAVCLSVVNRSAADERVKVYAECLPKFTGSAEKPSLRVFECGIDGSVDDNVEFGSTGCVLNAEAIVEIPSFCKKYIAVCLFFAPDGRTVSRGIAKVASDGFFARETFAAGGRAYNLLPSPVAEAAEDNLMDQVRYDNILCDGRLCAVIGERGYEYSIGGAPLTRRYDGLAKGSPTSVMMWVGGCINDLTDGENAIHGLGFSEYSGENNGYTYSLRRYMARGYAAEIFDLQITDMSGDGKTADVMFSALSGISAPTEVYRSGDRICVVRKADGKGFAIMASAPISDCAFYREGYYAYGGVDRATDFRKGGSETAPALSCRIDLAPFGVARVVFALAHIGEESELESINEEIADAFFTAEVELFTATGIYPDTHNDILDNLYLRALYAAYAGGFLQGEEEYDITCIAAKYIDADGVRRRILERLKSSAPDELLIYIIDDYVMFTGDDIYAETVDGMTVAELCINAADKLMCNAVDSACGIIGKVSALRVLKTYSNKCGTVRKRKYIKAMSVIAAEVEKYFYGNICDGSVDSVSESSLYVLGGVFPSRGREIVTELEPKVKRLCGRLSRESGEREIENVFSAALIYCAAAYAVNDNERAFGAIELFTEAFSQCGRLGEYFTPRLSAMFYSLVTTRLFGVNICGDKATLDPHIGRQNTHIEYLMPKSYGRTRVSVDDKNFDGDAWNMRVGRITYATTVLGENDCDFETVHLFRAFGDN